VLLLPAHGADINARNGADNTFRTRVESPRGRGGFAVPARGQEQAVWDQAVAMGLQPTEGVFSTLESECLR
jgi:hypothetical protein